MGGMNSPIRVGVVGAAGRMGSELMRALVEDAAFELALAVDPSHNGEHSHAYTYGKGPDVVIEDKLGVALDRVKPDAIVDFSHFSAAASHAISAVSRKIPAIVGTTGLAETDLREIASACREFETPCLYVPNFAVGAVLMMRFAEIAAKFLPTAEIIEMHHEAKVDAPSGTALLTAERIDKGRDFANPVKDGGIQKIDGVRGGRAHDVPIHSVRLPGLVAHQQVMFGGVGETLTIRHDSISRSSFMDGVKLCLRALPNHRGLVIGMDKILFPDSV